MNTLRIPTKEKREVVDITYKIVGYVPQEGEGALHVFVQHSTAGIGVMDLDPGTDLDFLDFLETLIPDRKWRHPHDPQHAPDHLLATLIGPGEMIPYKDGNLLLGTWQRLILVECDGPRDRAVVVTLHAEAVT